MLQTAYKVTQTRNGYGDLVGTTLTAMPCHFRYITEQVSGGANEQINSDAMAWLEPDSGVNRSDVLKIDNEYFRVERIIKARRLHDPTVQFLKVELLKYGQISWTHL